MRQIGFIFVLLNLYLCACLHGQTVSVYVTSQADDRITPKPAIHFSQSSVSYGRSLREIQIDDLKQDQKIHGFRLAWILQFRRACCGLSLTRSREPDFRR
jgi:hypothetical protein